jgi:hypothetical protein
MMQPTTLLGVVRHTLGHAFRNGLIGLLAGAALIEGLAALLNKESITSLQSLSATPSFTLFVHVAAVLFAVTLGVLCVVLTAAMRTVRGVLHGVNEAADAIDGPSRHGLF